MSVYQACFQMERRRMIQVNTCGTLDVNISGCIYCERCLQYFWLWDTLISLTSLKVYYQSRPVLQIWN